MCFTVQVIDSDSDAITVNAISVLTSIMRNSPSAKVSEEGGTRLLCCARGKDPPAVLLPVGGGGGNWWSGWIRADQSVLGRSAGMVRIRLFLFCFLRRCSKSGLGILICTRS